jgi:hypothetical protein
MKESYEQGLAGPLGPEPYADNGNVVGVAWARGTCRPGIELRNHHSRVPTLSFKWKATRDTTLRQVVSRRGGVVDPEHAWKLQSREPGDPVGFRQRECPVRPRRNGQRTSPTVMLA